MAVHQRTSLLECDKLLHRGPLCRELVVCHRGPIRVCNELVVCHRGRICRELGVCHRGPIRVCNELVVCHRGRISSQCCASLDQLSRVKASGVKASGMPLSWYALDAAGCCQASGVNILSRRRRTFAPNMKEKRESLDATGCRQASAVKAALEAAGCCQAARCRQASGYHEAS